jgi:hypothetical protein
MWMCVTRFQANSYLKTALSLELPLLYSVSMWWKKTVCKEEMGKALWQLCCDLTEDFDKNLRPKLRANGFLSDTAKDTVFMCEAMIVHFWLIWSAFNGDRAILDVFNNFFNGWLVTQQAHVLESVQERFALYREAISRDGEAQAQRLVPRQLANAALQSLLNNGKPDKIDFDFMIVSEVGHRL